MYIEQLFIFTIIIMLILGNIPDILAKQKFKITTFIYHTYILSVVFNIAFILMICFWPDPIYNKTVDVQFSKENIPFIVKNAKIIDISQQFNKKLSEFDKIEIYKNKKLFGFNKIIGEELKLK